MLGAIKLSVLFDFSFFFLFDFSSKYVSKKNEKKIIFPIDAQSKKML